MPLHSEIPSADDDAWTGGEGEFDGRPALLRFRPGLAEFLGHPRYPRRLVITWEYGDDDDSGMPDSEQESELSDFENRLNDALDPERIAILVFVFTSAGAREWGYYVGNDVDLIGERVNRALAGQPGLPIRLEVMDDPAWDNLRQLLEMFEE